MSSLLIKNKAKGFTLIELLVVIAIIGLLSSVVLASLNTARGKAMDASRAMSLRQMQTALEMYHSSNNVYPSTGGRWWSADNTFGNHPTTGPNGYIPGLAPKYISVLPLDPLDNITGMYGYLYQSNGKNYKLLAHQTPTTYPAAGQTFYDPGRPTWAWMLCSGEPACSSW